MQQYLDLLQDIMENGEEHDDRTGVGTISVWGRQLRFNLKRGFPIVTTKKVPFKWVVKELLWMLSGNTNKHDLLAQGVDIWEEWGNNETGDLGPIYGFQWRHFGANYQEFWNEFGSDREPGEMLVRPLTTWNTGVDQIANALHDIKNNPNSRRIIVSGWNPPDVPKMSLPPCHTLFQFKVHRDGDLSCHLFARSIDTFLGLPFNIVQYGLMTHIMAHLTGREVRDLVISFSDVHIYKNHFEQVREQLSRDPKPLPKLFISPGFWDTGLEGLGQMTAGDFALDGYYHHPHIPAPVAI